MLTLQADKTLYERELVSVDASHQWLRSLKKLGYTYRLTNLSKYGTFCYVCEIKNCTTGIYFRGYGKGSKIQAILGAKYEAIEHLTSIPGMIDSEELTYFSFAEALEKKIPLLESKIPLQLLTDESLKSSPLAWIKFTSIANDSYCFAPAVSCNPYYFEHRSKVDSFNYNELYLQNSDNGCATGATYNEALLHSLLEVIERDAISFFLINTFVAPKKNFLKTVNLKEYDTLFKNEKISISTFLKETHSTFTIYEMPNEFNVPAFCVVLKNEKFIFPIKGFGCSLSLIHALKRAITEAIEQYHVYECKTYHDDMLTLEVLNEWPELLPCVYFDAINAKQFRDASYFSNLDNCDRFDSLKEHVDYLIYKIQQCGFEIYVNVRSKSDDFCTVQSVVKDCEEFFSIIRGTINNIGSRGREMLYSDI